MLNLKPEDRAGDDGGWPPIELPPVHRSWGDDDGRHAGPTLNYVEGPRLDWLTWLWLTSAIASGAGLGVVVATIAMRLLGVR